MRRVLVTGAGGFAGLHLVRLLRSRGVRVYGLVRRKAQAKALRALGAQALLGDLIRPASLRRAVAASRPDAVAHLASPSFVPAAEAGPARTRRAIVGGTTALLEAVRELAPSARILLVSSGMVYGPARGRGPAGGGPGATCRAR